MTVSVNRSSFNGRNLFGFLQFGTLYKLMFVVLYLSTIHWKVNVQVAPESFPNTLYLIPPRAPTSSDNHSSACNRVNDQIRDTSLLKELSPRCLCQPKRKILDLGDSRTSLSWPLRQLFITRCFYQQKAYSWSRYQTQNLGFRYVIYVYKLCLTYQLDLLWYFAFSADIWSIWSQRICF